MIIYLDEIYSSLDWWRVENRINVKKEISGYLINVMGELGKLSQALPGLEIESVRKVSEYKIIEVLCNIGILTINSADIPIRKLDTTIDTSEARLNSVSLGHLISDCVNYNMYEGTHHLFFNSVLRDCAKLCESYGFNFEAVMLERIREINSGIKVTGLGNGVYNKKANYEKGRIEK